jgi:hypothetical protein
LEKIRSLESLDQTNLVKLITANGDSMTATFATKQIRVETVFGTVSLPSAMIRQLRVTSLGGKGRPKDGLIALWSGEGNGADSISGDDGSLVNVGFTDGVVGQAFSFSPNANPYGTYSGIQIPDRPIFALTQSLTIDAWIRPRGDGYMILTRGDHRPGLDPYSLSMEASQDLRFEICNDDHQTAVVDTTVPYGQWTHVAATLDGDAGTLSLYTNGLLAVQIHTQIKPLGALIPEMSPGIGIGNINDGGNNFPFLGDIDEVALYNRALSANEINAIYSANAANAGGRAEINSPQRPRFPPPNGYSPRFNEVPGLPGRP